MSGTPLYNPNDGLTGRDGGPYLDEVQAQQDEIRRARVEGREPDLDNPGANAGIQLATAGQMLATLTVSSNPSRENARTAAVDKMYADAHKEVTTVVSDEVPDTSNQKTAQDIEAEDEDLNPNDPNASVERSNDEGAVTEDSAKDNDKPAEHKTPAKDDDLGTPESATTTQKAGASKTASAKTSK